MKQQQPQTQSGILVLNQVLSQPSTARAFKPWARLHAMARAAVGVVLLTAMGSGPVQAQEQLENGATHTGNLALAGDFQLWTFTAQAGDTVVLRAGGAGFTPKLELNGPGGALLATSTSTGPSVREGRVTQIASATGTYTVTVSAFYTGGTGDYALRLARIPGLFNISAGDQGGAMSNGFQHTGSIDVGDLDVWTFEAEAGDGIVLRMGGTDFTPQILLYGPDGVLLESSASTGPATRDGSVVHRAESGGNYTVLAGAFYANGTGPYLLTLAQSPKEIEVAPGDEGGPMTNGFQHSGMVDVGDLDVWSFEAMDGDGIFLRMGGDGFTPWIRLYAPDGELVQTSGSTGPATRDGSVSHRAGLSGVYTVVVSSFYFSNSGGYILSLAQSPKEIEVAPGDEGGPMTNGFQHTGTIDVGDLDVWMFEAEDGDGILLRMGGSGFTPWIRLYAPDGELVGASASTGPATRDGNVSHRAELGGAYTVVASSFYFSNSGDYILTLAKAPGAIQVAPGDDGGPMINGYRHSGTIGVGDLDVWGFEADEGDNIVLRMGGDNFTPSIRLYAPDGELLGTSASTGPATRDGSVTHQALLSGMYTVAASAFYPGGSGAYILTLAVMPEWFHVAPEDEGGLLPQEGNPEGAIAVGELDLWMFEANAGNHITLRLQELTGGTGFNPWLRLYGVDGELLASESHATLAVISFEAPVGGLYGVVVGHNGIGGSGTYRITASFLPEQEKQLRVTRIDTTTVRVNWPSVLEDHTLEQNSEPRSEGWSNLEFELHDNGLNAWMLVPVGTENRLFRLRPPPVE